MSSGVDYRFTRHGFDDAPDVPGRKLVTYKGAYISITTRCNTDVCEYCYARDQSTGPKTMPLDEFTEALHWLDEVSSFPEVYLVGGEPTVVPNLSEYLDAIAELGWRADIYTNGAFPERTRDMLAQHNGVGRLAFHYELAFLSHPPIRERWVQNIQALAGVKTCSIIVVMSSSSFDLDEPLNLAQEHGLSLTWTFAAPSSGHTPYMGLDQMRAAGPALQAFLLNARARGVKTAPDLPTPLCVYDEEFLASYQDEFALVRKCKPFAYFRTDGQVQSCTAMPIRMSPRPTSADQLREIIVSNREADAKLKSVASFPECIDCKHHISGACQGGCMTYKVYAGPDTRNLIPLELLTGNGRAEATV